MTIMILSITLLFVLVSLVVGHLVSRLLTQAEMIERLKQHLDIAQILAVKSAESDKVRREAVRRLAEGGQVEALKALSANWTSDELVEAITDRLKTGRFADTAGYANNEDGYEQARHELVSLESGLDVSDTADIRKRIGQLQNFVWGWEKTKRS